MQWFFSAPEFSQPLTSTKPLTNTNCCVFQPANGCSACRSLVEIDFLEAFSCFYGKKIDFTFSPGVDQRLIVYQRLGVTPNCWCTQVYQCVSLSFPSILCLFYPFFVIFVWKTKESFEKVDFDQRTACRAPVRWSKYTTNYNPLILS